MQQQRQLTIPVFVWHRMWYDYRFWLF